MPYRDGDNEGCALPWHTVEIDCAAVGFNGAFDDSKAKPGALNMGGVAGAKEGIEEMLLIFGGYTDTFIMNLKSDHAFVFQIRNQKLDGITIWRIFDGIG